jgi:hypothetical protein
VTSGVNYLNPQGEHAAWVALTRDASSMGEGRVGADNNDGRGTAINVPSAMKDTEVRQGTEGGGKGGTRKEEPRTADAFATPAVVTAVVVMLEEENEQRVEELLTTHVSIATEMTTT